MATFTSLQARLLKVAPPLLPPFSPHDPSLTSEIASLQLHPTLETALHLLNLDLPSAHFLVRHMQSAPAYEGMYLHGILHRIEGDYDNARAWYSDVKTSDIYEKLWGNGGKSWKEWQQENGVGKDGHTLDSGQKFLDAVETYRKSRGTEGDKASLEKESRRELDGITDWCVQKFGINKMEDASAAWVQHSDEIRQMGEDQVSGNSGRRNF